MSDQQQRIQRKFERVTREHAAEVASREAAVMTDSPTRVVPLRQRAEQLVDGKCVCGLPQLLSMECPRCERVSRIERELRAAVEEATRAERAAVLRRCAEEIENGRRNRLIPLQELIDWYRAQADNMVPAVPPAGEQP